MVGPGGVIDFAGGIVVPPPQELLPYSSLMLGRRSGFPRNLKPPHSPGMVMMEAAMLWVGWFGFNAEAAALMVCRNGHARHSHLCSHRELGMDVHRMEENRQAGLVGIVTGTIAGLATITPASGAVGPMGAVIIGAVAVLVATLPVDSSKKSSELTTLWILPRFTESVEFLEP